MEIFEAAWQRMLRGKNHKDVELELTDTVKKKMMGDAKMVENMNVVKFKEVKELKIVNKEEKVEKKTKKAKKSGK